MWRHRAEVATTILVVAFSQTMRSQSNVSAVSLAVVRLFLWTPISPSATFHKRLAHSSVAWLLRIRGERMLAQK